MESRLLLAAVLFGGLGVILGAFGAHALRDRVAPEMLAVFETGVRYQMYHALALFAVALLVNHMPGTTLPLVAGWLFVAGIVLFSGSLYVLVWSDQRWLGAVTPVGGLAFVAGWGLLVIAALRGTRTVP